ncbi:MAG: hypothetical protein LQ340_002060 [Diploschistes diacapsis]|nr:MAG: hypothetical protein LQ340_002060 [Diploschistes diacapsis]
MKRDNDTPIGGDSETSLLSADRQGYFTSLEKYCHIGAPTGGLSIWQLPMSRVSPAAAPHHVVQMDKVKPRIAVEEHSQGLAALSLPQYLSTPAKCAWPDTPFTTSGRDIVSASGQHVLYAGLNWPGAADTMLPEGLQYNSVSNIISMIKSLGMNVIRLTYAIEMIDDIASSNPNQTLQNTLLNALGSNNGSEVLQEILKYNPSFNAQTTRLEV